MREHNHLLVGTFSSTTDGYTGSTMGRRSGALRTLGIDLCAAGVGIVR
jgi:hypothetical protein